MRRPWISSPPRSTHGYDKYVTAPSQHQQVTLWPSMSSERDRRTPPTWNMAIKIKIPRAKGFRGSLKNPFLRAGLAAFLIVSLVLFGVFSYYYIKYQKIVDKRMSGQIFAN